MTDDSGTKQSTGATPPTHPLNRIGKVVAVASGKGGVGKSSVTALLAVLLQRHHYRVGIMDVDITGPSIPKLFGTGAPAVQTELGIEPVVTKQGIKLISMNAVLEQEDAPVIWRGPIVSQVVKQFWNEVAWGELDCLLLDFPPGTGDVPLTVFQTIPLDGMIIVTTPQDLVALIVKKAYNMAKMMDVPILGLIENMSYLQCPDCGQTIELFGPSRAAAMADALATQLLGRLPVQPELARAGDAGTIENYPAEGLAEALKIFDQLLRQPAPV